MYNTILHNLLNGFHGCIGAMFLDYEGEAVSIVSQYFPHYDLQVIGAYEGIFLDRVNRISTESGLGPTERFTIRCGNTMLLNWVLKDGYYLVFVLQTWASEALAWRRMEICREELLKEM